MKERYIEELNAIHASEAFKERTGNAMSQQAQAAQASAAWHGGNGRGRWRTISAKRRPLAYIAAVFAVLLLCGGTAFAIWQSTAERVKEKLNAEAQLPEEELTARAEQYADEMLAAIGVLRPVSGSATVGGLTLTLTQFEQSDGDVWLYFSAVGSDDLGVIYFPPFEQKDDAEILNTHERVTNLGLDAYSFVLTVGGKEYPVYTHSKEDGDPAAWLADDGMYCVSFRDLSYDVLSNTPMRLSGTMHSYDKTGAVAETLGEFTIDFSYSYTDADRETDRSALIDDFKTTYSEAAAERAAEAQSIPDQGVEVGASCKSMSVNDIFPVEDGVQLGFTYHAGAGWKRLCIDGYETRCLPVENVEGESGSVTDSVEIADLYCGAAELPETSLFVVEDLDSSETLAFRYNWKTEKVALPADEAERAKWVEESTALSGDGRNAFRNYHYYDHAQSTKLLDSDIQQTLSGTSVSIWNVVEQSDGLFQIEYHVHNMRCDEMIWERRPVITVNGEPCEIVGAFDWTVDLDEWKNYYWEYIGTRERYTTDTWTVRLPKRASLLGEKLEFKIEWPLQDIDENCKRYDLGTFCLTVPVDREDYVGTVPEYQDYLLPAR